MPLLPTLSFGVTRYTRDSTGAINVSEETLQGIVVDVCTSLAGQGLPHVLIVNNHFEPEHVQTLHRALDVLEAAGIRTGFLDLTRQERAQRLTDEFRPASATPAATRPRSSSRRARARRPEAMARLPYVAGEHGRGDRGGLKDFRAMGLGRRTAARRPRRAPRRASRATPCWPRWRRASARSSPAREAATAGLFGRRRRRADRGAPPHVDPVTFEIIRHKLLR